MTDDELREKIAIALFTGILYGGHRDEWDSLSDETDTFPSTYSKNWYRCGAEDVMAVVRQAQDAFVDWLIDIAYPFDTTFTPPPPVDLRKLALRWKERDHWDDISDEDAIACIIDESAPLDVGSTP